MNKKILLVSIIANISISQASEFNVIIDNNDKSYSHGVYEEIMTEWVTVEKLDCNKDFRPSEFYYDKDFTQTETCLEKQERSLIKKVTYKNGTEEIISVEKETQSITTTETNSLKGTHLEENCENIILNGYSYGDGEYKITLNGGMNAYCDMTRNGGGWMRLSNYDWDKDSYNIPNNLIRTENRTITSYTGADYTFRNSWQTRDFTSSEMTANPNGFYWEEVSIPTNGFAWKQTMIDIHAYYEISIDAYRVATTSRDSITVNGQYLDGISLTYGNQGSRNHIYSITTTTTDISRSGLEWLVNSGNYGVGENWTGSNAIVSKQKPTGTENISARLMSNQVYYDEKVGLKIFKVWVK